MITPVKNSNYFRRFAKVTEPAVFISLAWQMDRPLPDRQPGRLPELLRDWQDQRQFESGCLAVVAHDQQITRQGQIVPSFSEERVEFP